MREKTELINKRNTMVYCFTCAFNSIPRIPWLASAHKGSYCVTAGSVCVTVVLSCFTLIYICNYEVRHWIIKTDLVFIYFQVTVAYRVFVCLWRHCFLHFSRSDSGKALDNIDLNRMSHRYVSGVLQNYWNDPVDFCSLDRSKRGCYITITNSQNALRRALTSHRVV